MKWQEADKAEWLAEQTIKRSYQDEVLTKIRALADRFELIQYGALSRDPQKYPLFLIKSIKFNPQNKLILITGGVHGYETSGVHGALEFMNREAAKYESEFNFVCAPCISPWSYETINRWNAQALDPNRSFISDSACEESRLFVNALRSHNLQPYIHFDLHETTDTDNTVFRPALEKRDGITLEFSEIPDGFYVVGDSENPQKEFQRAVIDEVRNVTHIAPPDEQGRLIGVPIEQEGVINYPVKSLYLCTGITDAEYTTTTEVYPDSPRATPEICIESQIAAIVGGTRSCLRTHDAKDRR